MVNSPFEIDERYFEVLAQNPIVALTKHRTTGTHDIWILGQWSRMFVDPDNQYKSEPTPSQAWSAYMALTGTSI
jgi:hypothetical protein